MPKPFTEQERRTIRDRLMDEGLKRFARQGVRAMRIDDLCRDVGIAKGSFYSFFASKEALFFALSDRQDEMHKSEMLAQMREATGEPDAVLGAFFDMVMERIDNDPLIGIIEDSGDFAYLMRHAPPGYVAGNSKRDHDFVVDMASLFQARFPQIRADADMIEGTMTLMLALRMQRDYLSSIEVYAPTTALLRDMFTKRSIEGPWHD